MTAAQQRGWRQLYKLSRKHTQHTHARKKHNTRPSNTNTPNVPALKSKPRAAINAPSPPSPDLAKCAGGNKTIKPPERHQTHGEEDRKKNLICQASYLHQLLLVHLLRWCEGSLTGLFEFLWRDFLLSKEGREKFFSSFGGILVGCKKKK